MINEQFKCRSIAVSVGYGWPKFDSENDPRPLCGSQVLFDEFWKSLQRKFEKKDFKLDEEHVLAVKFSRLRATHGALVPVTIRNRIAKSDILIYDVAAVPPEERLAQAVPGDDISEHCSGFNPNVMYELGLALGMNKLVLMLCPEHLFREIPSDLRGYCWSLYRCVYQNDFSIKRHFVDEPGVNGAYQGMLRRVANEIVKGTNKEF